MKRTYRWIQGFCCACVALLIATHALADTKDAAQLDDIFQRSTLKIATPDARLHTFHIWVANDDARRARGLMFVKQLPDDAGMLFVYEQPQKITMWMKNTFIPLDMVFVGADGKVINVAANTQPQSLKTIASNGDALGVIELKGGTAARLNIAKGAVVMHPAFDDRNVPR